MYAYNHAHDNASIKLMMKEIATADKQRDCAAISGPTGGISNMFTEMLQQMVMEAEENTSYSEEESAMAATLESDSSVERKSSRRTRKEIGTQVVPHGGGAVQLPLPTAFDQGAVRGAHEEHQQG